jgi:hypothetical protein
MTLEEIHACIVRSATQLDEIHTVISADHPTDEEGFVKPEDPDLADALTTMENVASALSRLAFKIARES